MNFTEFRSVWRRVTEAGFIAWVLLTLGIAASTARAQVSESYKVQPTDTLIIEVANEPKLSAREFRVSSSGELSYPFIGAIRAANRTTVEIQEEVKRLLEQDYLVNAQVLVQVRDFRKKLVAVSGSVAKAGLIEIPPERKMTAIEAITAAGGLTRLARQSGIQLIREGRKEPMVFNLDELKNPDKPVYVESGDLIYVPESRI